MRPELACYLNQTVDEIDSTNRIARELALAGAPHGSWTSAKRQTAGKGRTGNTWISPEGGIYLSMIIRDIPSNLWTWVPLTAAVATRDVLQKTLDPHSPEVLIKWPNDLWIKNRKVAGFLGETTSQFILLGIGINALIEPNLENNTACHIKQWSSSLVENRIPSLKEQITHSVIEHLEILTKSKQNIASKYERFAVFKPASLVSWNHGANTGKVLGIGDLGELQVQETGVWGVKSLFSEDISKIRIVDEKS